MKLADGFTLVEAMVVVTIIALTLVFGIPAFSTWKAKHDVEGQILRLYNDLQFARMQAYTEKVAFGLNWGAGQFTSYTIRRDANSDWDIDDDGTDTVVRTQNLDFSVTPSANPSVAFDGRGFCRNSLSLRVPSSRGASLDCITISSTRIITGRWTGGSCVPR